MEGISLQINEANAKEKELLIQYGSAASEAMFDFPCAFFRTTGCIGFVPHRIENNCAVVIGEPVCPQEEMEKLATAFHAYCHELSLNIIYIIVHKKFATWAKANYCSILMKVCDELIMDPQNDPCLLSSRLRHKVEKATKEGLTVYEYFPFDSDIEKAIKDVGIQWQQSIKGPSIFLGHLNFFDSYMGKRWFYIKDGEEITSMLMLCRLDAYNGWLLKFLITKPNAIRGTSEFLVTSVLERLRNENCSYLTKSVVPTEALDEIEGLGPFPKWGAHSIYKLISWVFKFPQRKEYWLKFHPQEEPAYLLFARPNIGINEIKALRSAFRTGSQLNK